MKTNSTPENFGFNSKLRVLLISLSLFTLSIFAFNSANSQANIDAALYNNYNNPLVISKPTGSSAGFTVIIQNEGLLPIYSATLKFSYANGPIVSSNWNGNLTTGNQAYYTFTTPISVLQGKSMLKVWIDKPGDTIHSNDTNYFDVLGCVIRSLPYTDNFDGNTTDFLTTGSQNLWERGIPNDSFLNSAHTTPNAWVTNLNGDYPNNSDESIYTPFFDFQGAYGASLSFWNKIKSTSLVSAYKYDFGNIQFTSDTGKTWMGIGYIACPLGNNWYNVNYSGIHGWGGTFPNWLESDYLLSQFDNLGLIQFRFRFQSDSIGTDEGWGIDDFGITFPPIPIDLAVDSILSPQDSISFGSSIPVVVRIKNNGTQTATSMTLGFGIDKFNYNPVLQYWNGNLAPGASIVDTFWLNLSVMPSWSQFKLKAWVKHPVDIYYGNDTAGKIIYKKLNVPFFDVGVTSLGLSTLKTDSLISGNYSCVVGFKNFGSDTLKQLYVKLKIPNQPPVIYIWSGMLAPGQSQNYNLNNTHYFMLPHYLICAEIVLNDDVDTSNNQICKELYIITENQESIDDFKLILHQNIPNPTGGNTRIDFEIPVSGKIKFQLTNTLGQVLESKESEFSSGRNSINLDVSKLAAGIYYYSIEMEGRKLLKKMVVE